MGRVFILALLLAACGCASLRRTGLRVISPAFYQGGKNLLKEGDWQALRQGLAPNLVLLAGLLESIPGDPNLLATLVKGHNGLAYGVWETLALPDKFKGVEDSPPLRQALIHYSKSFRYGLTYLQEEGLTLPGLNRALRSAGGVAGALDKRLGSRPAWRDLETVFFTASSLAGLVNLRRADMLLVGQLPLAKGMVDWVCGKKPDLHFGACGIFYAGYYASRPKMLGGDPQKGRRMFEELIKTWPSNWLIRSAFIEHSIVPMGRQKDYQIQKNYLRQARLRHRQRQVWRPPGRLHEDFRRGNIRLYQAIAMKRFAMIVESEKHLF